MNSPTETRPRPARRTVALTVSVIINLFLAALIGGHLLRSHVDRTPISGGNTPMTRQLARIESALPPRDAAAFRAVIERDRPRFAKAAQRLEVARRALRRQIAADPFDPQAAREALSAYRLRWGGFVGSFSGPLIDALSHVSPQGRRDLVAARRRARERFLHRRLR